MLLLIWRQAKAFSIRILVYGLGPGLIWHQVNYVIHHIITKVAVDDPVHQLEASEGDREKDATVLVDVRRSHPKQLVQVLCFAVRICWCWRGWRWQGHWHWWKRLRGHRRWWCFHVVSHQVPHLDSRGWTSPVLHPRCQVRADGSLLAFVMHAQVVHFEVNSLEKKENTQYLAIIAWILFKH